MAYGVKYRVEYKDNANVDKKIDIEELDFVGAVTDCEAADDPLQIEMPVINSPFTPVITTGATITLISTSNMMFMGLYSINPKKFRVKAYEGISSIPFWIGYVNTEAYSEGYSRLQDYDVSITCNDGFAVLERFKYLDAGGVHFSGFDTKWNVLMKILNIMGLPYQNIFFACEHASDGVIVATGETLFHQLKVDQANYYNEKDDPMTCLEVLGALLAPYPLQIRWHDGSLYIYDPSMLADASFSAKQFDSSATYVGAVTIDRNLDISAQDCEWDSDDQVQDIISGFSKQTIRFSPYGYDHAVPVIDLEEEANWTGTPVWTAGTSIYYLSGITAMAGFTLGTSVVGGRRENMESHPDIYLKKAYTGGGSLAFENTIAGIWLAGVRGSSILFKAKVFVRTKTVEYSSSEESKLVKSVIFKIAVEIGGLRPHSDNPTADIEWISSTTDFYYVKAHMSGGDIADQWVDVEFQFPWNFPAGEMVFKIYDDFKAYDDILKWITDTPLTNSTVLEVRFKEIEFPIITVKDPNSGGRIGLKYEAAAMNDNEFVGKLNEDFINEGPEIPLYQADGINVADRGAIRKSDKSYTTGWRKPGDIVSLFLPDILLRTLISQYRDSLVQLSGTLTAQDMMTGNGCLSFFTALRDTDYLGSRRMICMGGVYHDFQRTLNGTYLEIKPDDLTIVIDE